MTKKLGLLLITGIFLVSLIGIASAADVAYIIQVSQNEKPEFTDAMNDIGLTYDLIFASDVGSVDFDDYKLILLNDENFPNWAEIPVNEVPAVLVNGRHMDEWGWTKSISSGSQSIPMHINLTGAHPVGSGLPDDVVIYTTEDADIYYLDNINVFDGIEKVASPGFDSSGIVIGTVAAGSVLTKSGKPDTNVNANTVFFGIYESDFWTADTEQLFKNSLLFTLEDEDFPVSLEEGQNLISLPILGSIDAEDFIDDNPGVVSVKEFVNGELVDATTIENDKAYFIEVDEGTGGVDVIFTGPGPLGERNVALDDGMNLVGVTSLSDIDLDTLPANIKEVSRRGANGVYDIATRYSNGWFNEFPLEPGRGYWFKLNGGAVWSYSP
ncbi:hypothetical protein CMI45_02355 [Candidatus Pacearchaeota archaeon]|nr:hypothetical protein [Candidatus Pacearchaeota archaeon]|tara:strand:+ start:26 stop:1171 length:1146 start_codon:yes stop_codon:yes gene_type:complete